MRKLHQKEIQWYGRNIPDDTPMNVNDAISIVKSIEKFKNKSSEINWDELISQSTTSDIFKRGLFGSALYNELYYKSAPYSVKEALNTIGIWGPCWKNTAKYIANMVGNKKVLEIGAGLGILSLGLSYYGVDVIPTDISQDTFIDNIYQMNSNIISLDGIKAIDIYKDEIDYVLISWAPYETDLLENIYDRCVKYNLPIIYIGEGPYGCCGSEKFWDRIEKLDNYPYQEIDEKVFTTFFGIHDTIAIINNKGCE